MYIYMYIYVYSRLALISFLINDFQNWCMIFGFSVFNSLHRKLSPFSTYDSILFESRDFCRHCGLK